MHVHVSEQNEGNVLFHVLWVTFDYSVVVHVGHWAVCRLASVVIGKNNCFGFGFMKPVF